MGACGGGYRSPWRRSRAAISKDGPRRARARRGRRRPRAYVAATTTTVTPPTTVGDDAEPVAGAVAVRVLCGLIVSVYSVRIRLVAPRAPRLLLQVALAQRRRRARRARCPWLLSEQSA